MRTIYKNENDIHTGNLILVNAKHPFKLSNPTDIFPVCNAYPSIYIRTSCIPSLRALIHEIHGEETIVPVSGTRTHQEQTTLFSTSLKENGETFTYQFVALPDCSEHQTGLAIDLGKQQEKIDSICPDFPYVGTTQEFRLRAPQYGWIQRYQKEKEEMTGISHEPWHFRYVGIPHASIMKEKHFCLEEYISFLKSFSFENPLHIYKNGFFYSIYFVAVQKGTTAIPVLEDGIVKISGNNCDGFIVTIRSKHA